VHVLVLLQRPGAHPGKRFILPQARCFNPPAHPGGLRCIGTGCRPHTISRAKENSVPPIAAERFRTTKYSPRFHTGSGRSTGVQGTTALHQSEVRERKDYGIVDEVLRK